MRKSLFATVAVTGALAAAVISPTIASAATTAETNITFTVAGGALNITAPLEQPLTVAGLQATGALNPVTVTDARRGIVGWTTSAVSTAFTKPAPNPETTPPTGVRIIPATAVSYSASLPGVAGTTGVAVVTPTGPTVIDTSKPVQVATAVLGNNSATWTGTVTVTLPSNVTAGDYSGKITHSVV